MTRVALATAAHLPELDEDGPALLQALADEGLEPSVQVWDDETVNWAGFDLVVVRTTWDYFDRRDAFLAWAAAVPRLLNPAELLTWNTDKRYLQQLEAKGIPIVPTTWLSPGDAFSPPDHPFVVKPTVSAGARNTAAYPAGASSHAQDLLTAGRQVMVQPYVEGIDEQGETSLLFFGGAFSHAARKAAILTPGAGVRNDVDSRSFVTPAEATAEQLALAEQVLGAVPHDLCASRDLLYARVDLLPGPVLIELEVTEPSLFLRHSAGSAQRFAQAVAARLRS